MIPNKWMIKGDAPKVDLMDGDTLEIFVDPEEGIKVYRIDEKGTRVLWSDKGSSCTLKMDVSHNGTPYTIRFTPPNGSSDKWKHEGDDNAFLAVVWMADEG